LSSEAPDPGPHHRWISMGQKISAVPMDSFDPAFVLPKNAVKGYSVMFLHVFFDHDADGIITMTCRSLDNSQSGVKVYTPTSCVVSEGGCTLKGLTGSALGGSWATAAALTADTYYVVRVGVGGYHDIRCSFHHGGTPTSSDKITVDVYLTTSS